MKRDFLGGDPPDGRPPWRHGGAADAERMGAFGALLSDQWGVPVRTQAAYRQDPDPELEHAVLRLMSEAVADGVRLLGADAGWR